MATIHRDIDEADHISVFLPNFKHFLFSISPYPDDLAREQQRKMGTNLEMKPLPLREKTCPDILRARINRPNFVSNCFSHLVRIHVGRQVGSDIRFMKGNNPGSHSVSRR